VKLKKYVHVGGFWSSGVCICFMFLFVRHDMTPVASVPFSKMCVTAEKRGTKKGVAKDDSDDDAYNDSDAEYDETQDCDGKEKKTSDIAESFLSANCAKEEAIIQSALYHLEQSKFMRELAQKRAQEAKDDIADGVLHPDKSYCMVC
jgi:hypothetical protein